METPLMGEIHIKTKQIIIEVTGKSINDISKEELIVFLNTLFNHYESQIKELNKLISQLKGADA